MRLLFALALATSVFAQSTPEMTVPKVEHHEESHVEHSDQVTRKCPDGYEAHFVDIQEGFDLTRYWGAGTNIFGSFGEGTPGYTVCFSKKFMDEIRKNKDLVAPRPLPPRGV